MYVLAVQTAAPVCKVPAIAHALLVGGVVEGGRAVGLAGRFDVDDGLAGRDWRSDVGETDFLDVLFSVVGLASEQRVFGGSDGGAQGSESEGVFHDYGLLFFSV
jgi:hypothetical protein